MEVAASQIKEQSEKLSESDKRIHSLEAEKKALTEKVESLEGEVKKLKNEPAAEPVTLSNSATTTPDKTQKLDASRILKLNSFLNSNNYCNDKFCR